MAQPGALFLFDWGYFKTKALAQIAEAEAYFLTRLNHQTALYAAKGGRWQRVELPRLVRGASSSLLAYPVYVGACERVAVRLVAPPVPEAVVNERRRKARQAARKRGDTPSHAPLALLAWKLFVTNVSGTVWTPTTACRAYSLRWPVELVFKSWNSDLHLATLSTKTQEPPLCYLYGRLLLIALADALCPALRAALWPRQQRELSFLKLIRYLQTLADRWLQTLFAPPATLSQWLCHVCERAQRIIAKASRSRRTSAQRLRESLEPQQDCLKLTIKLAT